MTDHLLANTRREFFPALHGLRGLAVLYVVISHLGYNGIFLIPIQHDYIGKVGVWIFFVLSAFLLTTHLYDDIESASSNLLAILQYVTQRIFRIFPLLLLVLVFLVIKGDIPAAEFLKHLLLLQGYGEHWAIQVEFQYYFIMPIIVISTIRMSPQKALLLFIAILLITFFNNIVNYEVIFPAGSDLIPKLFPFLIGSTLSFLFYKNKNLFLESRSKFMLLIPMIGLIMLLIGTFLFRSQRLDASSRLYAPWISLGISLAIAILIYSGLRLPVFNKFMGIKPLTFLGEISFSIYLLHGFIIEAVKNLPLSTTFQAWISLVLSIVIAYISYRLVEKPGIRLGKKITQNILKPDLIHQVHPANQSERL